MGKSRATLVRWAVPTVGTSSRQAVSKQSRILREYRMSSSGWYVNEVAVGRRALALVRRFGWFAAGSVSRPQRTCQSESRGSDLPGLSRLSYNGKFQTLLGGRSTVGQRTLTPLIGVRIPASQPKFFEKKYLRPTSFLRESLLSSH